MQSSPCQSLKLTPGEVVHADTASGDIEEEVSIQRPIHYGASSATLTILKEGYCANNAKNSMLPMRQGNSTRAGQEQWFWGGNDILVVKVG